MKPCKFRPELSSLIIITGATRGLGRSITKTFAHKILPDGRSTILIMGRDEQLLKSLKVEIMALGHKVLSIAYDFAQPWTEVSCKLKAALTGSCNSNSREGAYDQVLLIHNAATLGPCSRRADSFIDQDSDPALLSNYLNLNVQVPILLTSLVNQQINRDERLVTMFVVNISSLLALQSLNGMSLYSSSKAGRDAYFRTLAVESAGVENGWNVLNYAPGPLDTDMMTEVLNNIYDSKVRESFSTIKKSNKFVALEDTCDKLYRLLTEASYTSGDHIDFYDP